MAYVNLGLGTRLGIRPYFFKGRNVLSTWNVRNDGNLNIWSRDHINPFLSSSKHKLRKIYESPYSAMFWKRSLSERDRESLEMAIMANGKKKYNFWYLSFFLRIKKDIPPECFHMMSRQPYWQNNETPTMLAGPQNIMWEYGIWTLFLPG